MIVENLWELVPLEWEHTRSYLESRPPLDKGKTDCHSTSDQVAIDLHNGTDGEVEVLRCFGLQNHVKGRGRSRVVVGGHHSWVEVSRSGLNVLTSQPIELMEPTWLQKKQRARDASWVVLDVTRLAADGSGAMLWLPSSYEHHMLFQEGGVQGRLSMDVWSAGIGIDEVRV